MSPHTAESAIWTLKDVEEFLPPGRLRVRPRFLYRAGLIAVAVTLILLQAIYLAMVAMVGYATYLYIGLLPTIFAAIGVHLVSAILAITPGAAGVIVTFFLLKPLLAPKTAAPALIALDPASEPVLFAFVDRLCEQLGSPMPARIDVDLRVNASASLRRGWWSLFSRDLVLTIGLPLPAGLSVRQFGSVLAHEFGHFSQHAGMKLKFLIGAIQNWFARVAYERDEWDVKLDEMREEAGWRSRLILNIAWIAVQCSRYVLRGLLHCANIVSAWFSREMEFDADRQATALAGAAAFGESLSLLPVLEACANRSWSAINFSWASRNLCEDFPRLVTHHVSALDDGTRGELVTRDLEEKTGRWSTHPSTRDRLARLEAIRGAASPAEASAQMLFADFAGLSRAATIYAYRMSLGDAVDRAHLVPAGRFVDTSDAERRRADAVATLFGPIEGPSRWFLLSAPRPGDDAPVVHLPLEEESTRYWSLLGESLLHHGAAEFIRAGGSVDPGPFQLSSGDPEAVQSQERESRAALHAEIARLRERFFGNGYRFDAALREWRDAYAAYTEGQEDFQELRYRRAALGIVCANAQVLSAARAANAREAHERLVRESCQALIERFSNRPCPPLETYGEVSTITSQLVLSGWEELEVDALAERILERADLVGAALLGELCASA